MFGWIIGWMAGQEVSRCASDDPSAYMSTRASVSTRLGGSGVEGGEPMMMMLRFSELAGMLAMEAVLERELK